MKQNEHEELQDDFEFEITSLDDEAGETPPVAQSPLLFLREHRKPLTFATASVVVLAILLLLFNIAPTRQLWNSPGPQATFTYHLDASPPWGHLFVDGQPVRLAARSYPLFNLTGGQHTLLWRADPFPPQQCMLVAPVGSGVDTCQHPPIPPAAGGTDSYISFPADVTLLSPQQRNALLGATRAAIERLQSSETVRAGDWYAQTNEGGGPNLSTCTVLQRAAICLADAHQPLRATLSLQLNGAASSRLSCARGACSSEGANCYLFCNRFAYDMADLPVSPTIWPASVFVQLLWQFTTLQGQVIAVNQADTFIRGQTNYLSVPLNITWNGRQWGVSIAGAGEYIYNNNPVCAAAMADLYTLENEVPAMTAQNTQISMDPVRGTTLASGCLIAVQLQNNVIRTTTPNLAPPLEADVMQRFGVLLAVNSVAHHLFPFLPVANSYEKQLAQQWVTLQPGGSPQSAVVTVSGA